MTRFSAVITDERPGRLGEAFGCYEIDSLPSQVGVAICHGFEVFPEHRGLGLGHELKRDQMLRLRLLGYRYAQCTVLASNAAQKAVLGRAGWSCMGTFYSTRQSAQVEIWGAEITETKERIRECTDSRRAA